MSEALVSLNRTALRNLPEEIEDRLYPYEAPPPLSDGEIHHYERESIMDRIRKRYEDDPNVYVWGDMFVYWEIRDDKTDKIIREDRLSPDIFVVFGVPKIKQPARKSFRVWRENGQAPSWVMEISSEDTYLDDLEKKRTRYGELGVKEYFIYDPEGRYIPERLIGFARHHGELVRMRRPWSRRFVSRVLGLLIELTPKGLVELYDRKSGQRLLRAEEREAFMKSAWEKEAKAREAAQIQAEKEAKAREEEEIARQLAESQVKEAQEIIQRLQAELIRLKRND